MKERLQALLIAGLTIMLSSCMIIPRFHTSQNRYIRSKVTPLATLSGGDVAYLLQSCSVTVDAESKPTTRCGSNYPSVAVHAKAWDRPHLEMVTDMKSLDAATYDAFPDLGLGSPGFERPAIATRGSTSEFIGVFDEVGFVWVRPRPTASERRVVPRIPGEAAYEKVGNIKTYPPVKPALVVRDRDEVWIFVNNGKSCAGDRCFSISKTLGVPQADLPEPLRDSFMLYYAMIGGRNSFQRVIPEGVSRYSIDEVTSSPKPGQTYDFDFNTVPKSYADFRPEYICDYEISDTEYYVFVGIAPLGVSPGSTHTRFKGCAKVQADAP